jgi:Zn-dependent M32 family carboxypeptidase
MDNAKHKPQPASAKVKLAELKRRLMEISDLRAAGALLAWDQATYLPKELTETLLGGRSTALESHSYHSLQAAKPSEV